MATAQYLTNPKVKLVLSWSERVVEATMKGETTMKGSNEGNWVTAVSWFLWAVIFVSALSERGPIGWWLFYLGY